MRNHENLIQQSRRTFLRQGALFVAASGLVLAHREGADAWPAMHELWTGVPILQGMTDATSAEFRVLVDVDFPVSYVAIAPDGKNLDVNHVDRFIHPSDPRAAVDRVSVNNLKLGIDYRLRVVDPATGKSRDERFFRALDPASKSVRFALISCMNDRYPARQGAMWKAVEASKPDLLIFVGDACYADQRSEGGEKGLWKRHLETRRMLDVFKWQKLVPILATWDDHDFGLNNGDGTFPFKHATKQMFEAMFGTAADRGMGVASAFEIAGQRFFLMDDRTERGLDANAGHWGSVQEEWLFAKLNQNAKPAWLLNGSQYFGGFLGKESFQSRHPAQLKRVLERLKKTPAPVVFGSGDVHFSEILRLEPALVGYETYELTSSSIHSISIPGFHHLYRNPRRENATSFYNFMSIESRVVDAALEMKVTAIGATATYFERQLRIKRGA